MRCSALIALSAAGLAAAATNFTIDTSSISASTRSNWCAGQENTCSTLCDNNPKTDSCDTTTLDYSCTCQNGSAPGLEYYTQTMYTYVCEEAYAECISNNPNNATAQRACKTDIQDLCGTLDPTTYTASSSSSSSSSASATATSSATGTAASASETVASATSTAGAMATHLAHYGNGAAAVAVGVLAYLL